MLVGAEGQFFQQFFHHRIQPARADILGALVHLESNLGHAPHAVIGEAQLHAFGLQQRLILACQTGIGSGENARKIVHRERVQLDADRKPALQFRDQVGGLGQVKRTAADEQNMIGLDHAIFGADRRAFH